jgi:RNA polymerase sigma-70 factor, ECF subfamily
MMAMPNEMFAFPVGRTLETDQELIDRFQQGEERAFDELVRRHEQRIRSLCHHYLHDAADVQDAAQETFIRAYRALPEFRPEASFTTWLYRIAVNRCLNHLRSRRRRRWMQPFSGLFGKDEQAWEGVAEDNTPLQEVEKAERLGFVRAALDALPQEQRTAVILHRFQGLKYQEIAEVTGSSMAAVEARLHRAKLNLTRLLAGYIQDEE